MTYNVTQVCPKMSQIRFNWNVIQDKCDSNVTQMCLKCDSNMTQVWLKSALSKIQPWLKFKLKMTLKCDSKVPQNWLKIDSDVI